MNLDKDRIAILLYGEYRTFDVVNTFWDFKENQNIDFYFSTWNFSHQGNDELNIHHKEKITTNSFTKYFKQNIPFLNIMDLETEMDNYDCKHEKYITHREKGVPIHLRSLLKMMDTTSYDYIVLSRLDVYFDLNLLETLSLKQDEIGASSSITTNDIIHDLFFYGNGNIMHEFIRKACEYNHWGHACIGYFNDNKIFKFKSVNANSVIVRPNCRDIKEFKEGKNIWLKYDDLTYDKIIGLKDEYNNEKARIHEET